MFAHRPLYSASLLGVLLLAGIAHGNSGRPAGTRPARTSFQQEQRARGGQKYVPGQLLVRFRRGISKLSMQAEHAGVGAEVLKEFRIVDNLQLVRLPAGMSVMQAQLYYRQRPDVLYAEPNYIRHADQAPVTPNDPQYSTMWNLHNTGQNGGTPGADIHAPEAWGITTGSSTVVVAIIDSGIDYNHPDIAANMFRNSADCNSNGIDDDGNGFVDDCFGINPVYGTSDPLDDVSHGTHVSGTIGAVGNNAIGVVGVNWTVRLMACKFLDSTGSGSTSDEITCLQYVATMKDRGVNIVATNNSYGGGDFSQAEMDAIDAQRQRGILFVTAAGNGPADNDSDPHYPASYYLPNIIAVANTDRNDGLRSTSDFGRHSVHLGAPGTEILSTVPGNSYATFSGTSMSTPHVTGVAALLKAQNPSRDWKAMKNLILAGGDTKPAVVNTITQKRLNANGALTCSNSIVRSRLQPVVNEVYATAGKSQTLAALHINCAAPNGSVQVSVDSGASTITLNDDGLGADQESGDGIYSAQQVWLLAQVGDHTLTFPNSDVVTVHVIPPLSPYVYSSPVPFNYRTITGTNLNLSDDSTAQITPPFPVLFGGASFSKLNVASNGMVTFTQAFSSSGNEALPTTGTTTLVAPWWDDLFPIPGTAANIFWDVLGSAPNRELVIEWRDVEHFDCDPGLAITFEVVFFESSSDILFNYVDTRFTQLGSFATCSEDTDGGASATVGVQVDTGVATQFSFDSPSLTNFSSILWKTGQLTPAITQISPFSALTGSSAITLQVTGSNFFDGSVVRWNGSDRPTTFINNTQLSASIPATDLAAATTAQVTVFNPPPNGSGASAAVPFNVYTTNPVPTLTSVTPNTLTAGTGATLTLTGTNFVTGSVARWNGSDRPTTPISGSQLQFSITSSDVPVGGTTQVTVFNPAPGGGTSNAVTEAIENPIPTLTKIVPIQIGAGGPAFTVQVIGTNFVPTSVVQWNSADRPTTFVDAGKLTATISAADIATPSTSLVRVFTPAPGGGFTGVSQIQVVNPPANDNVANPTQITSFPFSQVGLDTRGAGTEATDPTPPCSSVPPDKSVWFRFTPPAAGAVLNVTTSGSNYNTLLSAWTGSPGNFTNVACNDDESGVTINSRVRFTATSTNPIYFMVTAVNIGEAGFLNFVLAVEPTFTLAASPASNSVTRGTPASYTVTVTPQFGNFTNPIALACSVVPVGPTCSLSPASVTPGGAAASVTATVATTNVSRLEKLGEPAPLFAFWLTLPAFGLLAARRILPGAKKAKLGLFLALILIVAMLGMQAACGGGGGGGGGGTPPPPQTRNFTITVTGTSGTISQQTTAALTVTF